MSYQDEIELSIIQENNQNNQNNQNNGNGNDNGNANNENENENENENIFNGIDDIDEDELRRYLLMDHRNSKTDYETNIQQKLSKLYTRMRYAQHKYHDIRTKFTHIGITIMIISFVLTLVEALRNTMDLNEIQNKNIRNCVILIPLILSLSLIHI